MAKEEKMTSEQIREQMRQLRRVFASVRLIPERNVQGRNGRSPCYAHWKRDAPCENCVGQCALQEKERRSKLEYLDGELYEVIALYVEVDDSPCVLELAQKLDRNILLDPENGDQLISTVTTQREMRYRDALTGAYNRLYYDENYHGRCLTAGVALLDLDDLKLSNDIYGRSAGDVVLETAANIVRRNLSRKDRLIRYSGDEMLLILPDIGQDAFSRKLEEIRMQLNSAGIPGHSHIRMSASIGGIRAENADADSAVEQAARLMQYARIQKDTVVVEPQQQPDAAVMPHCRQSVLIVDDSLINRRLLGEMLSRQYDTAEAASGEECLRFLEQNPTGISIVLLDIHMSGIDGFAVLEAMRQRRILEQVPVIMISTEDTVDAVCRAFDLGASDYISRPFDEKVVYQRVANTIRLYAKQRRLSAMVADQVCEQEKRTRMLIDILISALEQRNGDSREQIRQTRILTGMLLSRLAGKTDAYPLTQEVRRTIGMASVLHDLGMLEVPEKVLCHRGRYTPEETEQLRQHTVLGAKMLEELGAYQEERFIRLAEQICRWHHERYDGSGYPDGLAGEKIPIAAQVVGLADAYETLVTGTADRAPVPDYAAVQQLCAGECGAFNPLLLECLQEIGPGIEATTHRKIDDF